MSLKDTIRGARQEAEASGNPFERPSSANKKDAKAVEAAGSQGFKRRSAAKAKPSRQAAAGVRVVRTGGGSKKSTKPKEEQTKEERKAERKHDREVGDLRYNVGQQILEEREDYKRARKLWWRFLIGGIILMVAAVGIYLIVSRMGTEAPEALGIFGIVTMVGAYIVVIGGLIFDWVKIRPIRREVDAYVNSMSEKRLINSATKNAKEKDDKGNKSAGKGRRRKK